MVTGFPGCNRKRPPRQKHEHAKCLHCGKPVNEPNGARRILVFGDGWYHLKCWRSK